MPKAIVKTIKVSTEVYDFLQRHARAFEDTPDDVLKRLLSIESAQTEAPLARAPITDDAATAPSHAELDRSASVSEMRGRATSRIRTALSESGKADALAQERSRTRGTRRGPREQRLVTVGGQVIYLRTRSFDASKPPFFTVQPWTLEDADWFVFVCDQRGDIVMPADDIRRLAAGLHRDLSGDYKPTFIIDEARCQIYAHGEPVEVGAWRDGYSAIAEREPS